MEMHKKTKAHRFTLVELLTTMAIILVLAALIIAGSSAAIRKQKAAETRSLMKQLQMALDEYRQDWGYYPPETSDKEVDWDHTGFQDPKGRLYMEDYPTDDNKPYKDAWQEPFYYVQPGKMNPQSYDLWSKGHDRQHGDEGGTTIDDIDEAQTTEENDDITNWKQR